MKKMFALVLVMQMSQTLASNVAVIDSGVDISHKIFNKKVWTNVNEKVGSEVDIDGSGLPGDVNGWDFTKNSATVFDAQYNNLIDEKVKKFYELVAKMDRGVINPVEYSWLEAVFADKAFLNQANFIGGYAHGTHVAGISLKNNPNAKVMSLKIIPTEYTPYVETSIQSNGGIQIEINNLVKTQGMVQTRNAEEEAGKLKEFQQAIVNFGVEKVKSMMGIHSYVAFQKMDVANESFGIGFLQAAEIIGSGFVETIGREPTKEELIQYTLLFFKVINQVGPNMFNVAPETLFVVASGNDNLDIDIFPDFPSSIKAANKIVVAATLDYSSIATFSNYGAKSVDVAAPGVAIYSAAPAQNTLPLSGTSQAAPYVTNVISLMKDLNPALKTAEIKTIILSTVDKKEWLKDKVATSGIVNKDRALKAAELSLKKSVAEAIKLAKATVADAVVIEQKANPNAMNAKDLKLKFKPYRPSLVIAK